MQMSTELWFLAMGVAIPAVCLTAVSTALFLMKRKSKKKELETFLKQLDFNRLIGDSLQNQILSRQMDKIFDAIIENIETERLKMREMLNIRTPAADTPVVGRVTPEPLPEAPPVPVPEKPPETLVSSTPLVRETPKETIETLARKGLSNREIARSLKRPQAEIDLFLKLRKMDRQPEALSSESRAFHAAV